MISFKILTEEALESLLQEINEAIPDADMTYASDNLHLLLEDEEDTEYAVSHSHGCLLIRVYDDEYSFIYPLPLCDGADKLLAAMEIRAYAVKEEIPLVYTDVRAEDLGTLLPKFRHINIDTHDSKNRFYVVRVMSEIALLDEMPEYYGYFGVGLTPLTEEDDADYTRLCTDRESNKHWGYDYSEDEPDPSPTYFRESAECEFYRGVALCLAVRAEDVFVGEATLYYFDLLGGCECAVRILPEFRRKGYATHALRLLKTMGKRLGLINLSAQVDVNNAASVAMTGKVLPEVDRDDKTVRFCGKL